MLAIKRRSSLKSLSRVAAQKAQSLQHERALALDALVQRTETALMSYEEECMHRSVAHEQAADLAEELVTELLDAAWAAIRKVRLSQKKLHRKSPTSPAKTPAKDKTELDAPEDFKIKSPTSALFASDTCWPAAKEAQDVTPIAEYLSQQFTQAHRRKPTWTPRSLFYTHQHSYNI